MSAIIKTLKTTTNDVEQSVYPKTVLEAVVDAETNETLDVILDELNEKIDNIEVSGEGIDEVNTYLQRGGSKNLLKVTVMSGSTAGVTHTVNEDKSISTSGVGTTNYTSFTIGEAYLKANTEYILSGCPKTDQPTNYNINVYYRGQIVATDNGDSVTFTVSSDGNYSITMPIILSVNYDGLVYYPMVRLATVEDDTYEPYYEDAMTIVNNALVHGDVVDNLLSTATSLPLSANMGRDINERLNAHSERFEVLYERSTFSIVKIGKIVRLVGATELTNTTQEWYWIFDFRNIADKYKPLASRTIKDVSQSYKFELNKYGYIQTAESLPAGTYYFDVAWLIP